MPEYLPPPNKLTGQLAEHVQDQKPFGADIIHSEEERVGAILSGDYHERAANYVAQFQDVPDPRYGRLKPFMNKLMRKNTGGAELKSWLLENGEMNLALLEGQHMYGAELSGRLADMHEDSVEYGLRSTRRYLSNLPEEGRESLADYFAGNASPFLQQSFAAWQNTRPNKQSVDGTMTDSGRHHESDIVDWLTEAPNDDAEKPNDQLLNFLQWHNDRSEAINRAPATQERIARERADYTAKVTAAIDAGILPEDVRGRLSALVDVPVFIGDAFDMQIMGRAGTRSPDKIVLTEDYGSKTFRHEMNHELFGGFEDALLDEAVTEHLALALGNGDFVTVNPYARDDEGTYDGRRCILGSLLEHGRYPIAMKTLLAAYSERRIGGEAKLRFETELRESFGLDVRDFVQEQTLSALPQMIEDYPDYPSAGRIEIALMRSAESLVILDALRHGLDAAAIIAARSGAVARSGLDEFSKQAQIFDIVKNLPPKIESVERYLREHTKSAPDTLVGAL